MSGGAARREAGARGRGGGRGGGGGRLTPRRAAARRPRRHHAASAAAHAAPPPHAAHHHAHADDSPADTPLSPKKTNPLLPSLTLSLSSGPIYYDPYMTFNRLLKRSSLSHVNVLICVSLLVLKNDTKNRPDHLEECK